MIEKQRINSKYGLQHYLRDGIDKIMKSERDLDFSILP